MFGTGTTLLNFDDNISNCKIAAEIDGTMQEQLALKSRPFEFIRI